MRDADQARFADDFGGAVFRPGDDGYQDALDKAIWNGDSRHRAAVIARATSAQQVATALRFARTQGMEVTVRGGGHSFAGLAAQEGALMVDLGGMTDVVVDPATKVVRVGGGAPLAALDAATAAHGLAVPGGTISHTGIAGLTLGGGFGWLTRLGGLTCDHLVGAEVVTADGRIVHASDDENPELMWALRGGGGNFGVVTTFEYQAHDLSPMANLGLFFWEPDHAREPLRFAREYLHALPSSFGAMIAGLAAPPAPFVPPEHVGKAGYAVLVANWDSAEEHANAVKPLQDLNPLFMFTAPVPHVALQTMLDDAAPWGIHGYDKAHYLGDLPDEVIDAGLDAIGRRRSPMSLTPIFPLGGAFAEADDGRTAFGGDRAAIRWAYDIAAVAPNEELLAADREWARDLYDALTPYATGGTYVNFISEPTEERSRAVYGPKYARLQAVKAEWDPDNVFHHNVNITPAS
ncbi:FAD-binding oxidoreductase [Hamadaea tsunoensis]|uniref:FAD-binding oxidoreductase n=1 Tax=Hamadaea tsunoensis TaxID=53368 RepID=UPI0006861E1C|nr:FAD-binding oxidoreductase [Hamadaea tsunoensis]